MIIISQRRPVQNAIREMLNHAGVFVGLIVDGVTDAIDI